MKQINLKQKQKNLKDPNSRSVNQSGGKLSLQSETQDAEDDAE